MPLLGKVIFNELGEDIPSDTLLEVFEIPHTGEKFISKEIYDERVLLYNRKVWTCQSTGHINLNHKEAIESEMKSKKMLEKSFPTIYEKAVLSTVHHSSMILYKLVDEAYRNIHSQLFVDENVTFEGIPGKKHEAKIITVEPDDKESGENGSPSSDKENHSSKQSLITDMLKSVKSSNNNNMSSGGSSSSDGASIEMQKLKYDVVLLKENKVIRGVPPETLKSSHKHPSRALIKLFIRSYAIRCEYKKMTIWIVNKEMVEKHGLKGRLTLSEEKRFVKASSISSNKFVGYTSHTPIQVVDDNLEDAESIGKVLQNGCAKEHANDKKKTVKKLAPLFSPKLKNTTIGKNGLEKSSPKNEEKRTEKKTLKRKRKDKKLTTQNLPKKKKVSALNKIEIISDDDLPLSKLAKSKALTSKTSSRKSTSPKKKRQATLLELTRKKGGMMLMTSTKTHTLGSSPSSSPAKKTQRAPRQPPIVHRLLRLKKEKKFQAHKYKMLLNDAARMLNEKQRKNLPDLVKQEVILKWEMIDRKRKWDNMSPEERKQFRAAERLIKNKKYDDMDIVAREKSNPLPLCEPVVIPGGLPNTMFGDIALVTEFLHCYKSLLYHSPRDIRPLSYWEIAEALSSGKRGYDVISHIMVYIFQVLLSDGVADDYKDLEFRIDEVPKTSEVCSELARICLRQLDDDLEMENQGRIEDDEETARTCGTGISEETFLRLLENEMYELDSGDQLEVLCSLIYRFINTYAAQQHRDDLKDKSTEAYKKWCKLRIEDNQMKKEKKLKEVQDKNSSSPSTTAKEKESEVEIQGSPDLVSRVKRRRIDAAERRQAQEEERLKWDEERRKLFEEQSKEEEQDRLRRQLKDAEFLSARSLRMDALGTDRHHNRYWLFSDHTPGLYVEKGWVGDSITYTTNSGLNDGLGKQDEDELPLTSEDSTLETTLPHVGQNLWFVVDSKEKLDELISSLCSSGIRESGLKKLLEKKYKHVIKSIAKYQSNLPKQSTDLSEGEKVTPPATRNSNIVKDAEEDSKKLLRKRLHSIIHDICRGNLGNIQDEYEIYVARAESALDVADFKSLFVDVFKAIDMRFFREYMNGCAYNKKKKREELLPYEEQQKLENQKKIAKAEGRREKWVAAVEGAIHFSRLSFLLTILHSNVQWEMYKYCRTVLKRTSARTKNYGEMIQESNDTEEEVEEEEDYGPAAAVRRSSRLTENSNDTRFRRSKRKVKYIDDSEEEAEESSADEKESDDDSQEEDEEEDSKEEESESESEDDEEIGKCAAVINRLLQYKCSSLFRYRVEEEDVPDYYDVVQNPICLLDIKDKIERAGGGRESIRNTKTRSITRAPQPYLPDQLMDDIRLVVDNAEMYNGRDTYVWRQAIKLGSAFSRCFQENFRHSVRLTKKLRVVFSDDTQ